MSNCIKGSNLGKIAIKTNSYKAMRKVGEVKKVVVRF